MTELCENCKFWLSDDKPEAGVRFGECRRHAPQQYGWPWIAFDKWCGEYEKREEVKTDDR